MSEALANLIKVMQAENPDFKPRERSAHEQALYEKDLKIAQLESRVRDLERRVSDYGWAESARHAALSGGTL